MKKQNKITGPVGLNMFSILSEALYTDPYRIFREYIQNSIDSIYSDFNNSTSSKKYFIKLLFLDENYTQCDQEDFNSVKHILIADNGAGLVQNFDNKLKTIANSTKLGDESSIGYMGIGRLAAYDYCKAINFINLKDTINSTRLDCDFIRSQLKENINELNVEKIFNYSSDIEKKVKSLSDEYSFVVLLEDIRPVLGFELLNDNFISKLKTLVNLKVEYFEFNKDNVKERELIEYYDNHNKHIIFDLYLNSTKLVNSVVKSERNNIYVKELRSKDSSGESRIIGHAKIEVAFPLSVKTRDEFGSSGMRLYSRNILVTSNDDILDKLSISLKLDKSVTELSRALTNFSIDVYINDDADIELNASRTWFKLSNSEVGLNTVLVQISKIIYSADELRYSFSKYNRERKKEESKIDSSNDVIAKLKSLVANFETDEEKIRVEIEKTIKEEYTRYKNSRYDKNKLLKKIIYLKQPSIYQVLEIIKNRLYDNYKNNQVEDLSEHEVIDLIINELKIVKEEL